MRDSFVKDVNGDTIICGNKLKGIHVIGIVDFRLNKRVAPVQIKLSCIVGRVRESVMGL